MHISSDGAVPPLSSVSLSSDETSTRAIMRVRSFLLRILRFHREVPHSVPRCSTLSDVLRSSASMGAVCKPGAG